MAAVTAVAFSPDSSLLATASDDGVARIFETASGTRQFRLDGHTSGSDGGRFLPGRHAHRHRVGQRDRADLGHQHRRGADLLGGHSGPVAAVAYSPDGTRIATVSDDSTVLDLDLLPAPCSGR